jgi:hypothetical protein
MLERTKTFQRPGGGQMVQAFFRMVSAAGLLTLALFFVGVDPFLSAGATLTGKTQGFTVNRALKGDRLPLVAPTVVDTQDWQTQFNNLRKPQASAEKPFACDPAFSPIFVKAKNVYGRCLT